MAYDYALSEANPEVWTNVIMIAVIIGVIVVAVKGENWGKKENVGG